MAGNISTIAAAFNFNQLASPSRFKYSELERNDVEDRLFASLIPPAETDALSDANCNFCIAQVVATLLEHGATSQIDWNTITLRYQYKAALFTTPFSGVVAVLRQRAAGQALSGTLRQYARSRAALGVRLISEHAELAASLALKHGVPQEFARYAFDFADGLPHGTVPDQVARVISAARRAALADSQRRTPITNAASLLLPGGSTGQTSFSI